MTDPEFIAAVKKSSLDYSRKLGDKLAIELQDATKVPQAVLERTRKLNGKADRGAPPSVDAS